MLLRSISFLSESLLESKMVGFLRRFLNVLIESVELVAIPDAPAWQEKIYRAHLDSGEDIDLFQQMWDVPISPESLVGLTPEEARQKRTQKVIAAVSGNH